MRINRSWAKGEARKLWHPFFPWWPRKLGRYWVFFEWIERRGTHHVGSSGNTWWRWEYREPKRKWWETL